VVAREVHVQVEKVVTKEVEYLVVRAEEVPGLEAKVVGEGADAVVEGVAVEGVAVEVGRVGEVVAEVVDAEGVELAEVEEMENPVPVAVKDKKESQKKEAQKSSKERRKRK